MEKVTGKYAVGTSCFSTVDSTRKEILGTAEGNRKIAVRMYYPIDKETVEGQERATIFSERKATALSKAYHVKNFSEHVPNQADYYERVEISLKEKFPLIVFNHGYNSYVEANTFLCCELASQGYVIASIGHAFEAIENDYEDGSFDFYDRSLNKKVMSPYWKALFTQLRLLKKTGDDRTLYEAFDRFQRTYGGFMLERIEEWARDVKVALQEVKTRYAQSLDLSSGIGASGHSFGGALAYYLCQYEEEFSCGVNIDGALFGDYTGQTMEKPFLEICCEGNYNVETKPMIDTNAPVYVAKFRSMKHIGFTDAKFFVSMKALVGKLEPQKMQKNLNHCHLYFFNRHLKNLETAEPQSNEAMEWKHIVL